jgi:hypothetical protein
MYELKQIKEDQDLPDLTILNLCDTRWLSWSNVINNFHQIIDAIQIALQNESNNPGHSEFVDFLCDSIDAEFLIVTKFLADIFFILKKMILVFQSDYVSLSETRNQVLMVVNAINSNFIGTEENPPTYGIHLARLMDDLNLLPEDLPGMFFTFLYLENKFGFIYNFCKSLLIN